MSPEPNSPVTVYRAATHAEAAAVITALEAERIKATATGTFTSAFQAEAPGEVEVVVRQSDLEKAERVIAKFKEDTRLDER